MGGHFVLAKYSFEFKMKVVKEYHAGKGSYEVLAKKKSTTPKDTIPADEYAAKLKELEDENLKLRIENAYLKELRRLRLAEEAKTKK